MTALVLYGSVSGTSARIAREIATGLRDTGMATFLRRVGTPVPAWDQVGLLVVGGPVAMIPALTRWLALRGRLDLAAAAFDTRRIGARATAEPTCERINALLRRHGGRPAVHPRSFLVGRDGNVPDLQLVDARVWGTSLAAHAVSPALA